MAPSGSPRWAIFLDRDGVINELVPDTSSGRDESPYRPEDVELAPMAPEALRILGGLGVPLVVVSNQPSAAKGETSLAALRAVHERVLERLAGEGVALSDSRYCFHHPDAVEPALRGPCGCRKPEPGLILAAADSLGLDAVGVARSWVIGDSDVDVEAGKRAGCRTVLVENPRSAHRRGAAEPDVRCADLLEVARAIAVAPSTSAGSRHGR
jgi:D-glycero-D-manno-heptose 1,7-bisphosphate phosphatase